MSLEQKFLNHSFPEPGRKLRMWIGVTLLAWLVMLAAIANVMLQTDSRMVQGQGDVLNEIAPAAGSGKEDSDKAGP